MSTITDSIGRVLSGRYRIVAPLGSGASAHVFAAWDVTLQRRVAVKVLHPALAGDSAFLRRFRSEARAAAALAHPHVLAVYDWGEDDGGPFLVLEYLGGGSLRDVLDVGQRLSVSQAVAVGTQAADGLAYAHARGFVHRDVKPANLLFDEEGRLRVADFGLARALAEAALTEPSGATVGTARYAAPEQALGHRVDGRTDVYSLALVLYEAVTGVVPFSGDTTLSTLMARVNARLPVHDALGALGPVLMAASASDPEDRLDAATMTARLRSLTTRIPPPTPLPLRRAVAVSHARAEHSMSDDDRTELGLVMAPPSSAGASDAALATGVDERPAVDGAPGGDASVPPDTGELYAVAAAVGVTDPARRAGASAGESAAAPARRRWPWIIAVVLVAGVLVAGGAVAAVKTKLFTPSHRVPAVTGMTYRQADAALRRDHLLLHLTARRSSTTVALGHILGQAPGAGTSLKEGSTVSVVVSSGPPPVQVPSLAALSGQCPTMAAVLAAVHLRADCIYRSSTTVPKGAVIAWSPSKDAPEFSTVQVVISTGPPVEQIPALQGSTCAGATTTLNALGLSAHCVSTPSLQTPAGQVLPGGWSPSGSALWGSTVTVMVSSGPPTVSVPDLDNDKLDKAIALLQQVGLVPGSDNGPVTGRVFHTNPPAGAQVPEGTTVDLYTQ